MTESVDRDESRVLQLLEAVAEDPYIRQVDLAGRVGVAVGTVNWLLKRLTTKGYVKVKRIGRWQWRYLLTPRGVREKARLTQQYLYASFRIYRETREDARQLLGELKGAGHTRVCVDSGCANDLLDIYRLTCAELGVKVAMTRESGVPTLTLRDRKVVLNGPTPTPRPGGPDTP